MAVFQGPLKVGPVLLRTCWRHIQTRLYSPSSYDRHCPDTVFFQPEPLCHPSLLFSKNLGFLSHLHTEMTLMRYCPYFFLYFSYPRPTTLCEAQIQQCWSFPLGKNLIIFPEVSRVSLRLNSVGFLLGYLNGGFIFTLDF